MVRLVGDSSQFNQMLADATRSVQSFAKSTVSSLAALGTASYLKQGFNLFSGKETTMNRLNAVLEVNNRNVKETTDSYSKFADQMTKVSTLSELEVMNLLRSAETFDLTGDAAKRAVRDSAALASSTGISVDRALKVSEALEKGDVALARSFSRWILPLRNIKNDAEFVKKYQNLVASGVKAQAAEFDSAAGVVKRLKNEYRAFLSSLGEFVAKGMVPLIKYAIEWMKWLRQLPPEVKQNIAMVMGLTAAFLSLRSVLYYVSMAIAFMTNPLTLLFVAAMIAVVAFVHELGGINNALEFLKGKGTEWLNILIENFYKGIEWIKKFIDENRKLALAIALGAAAIIVGYSAYYLLSTAIITTLVVMKALGVTQLLSISLWVLWKVAVFSAWFILTTFTTTFTFFKTVMLLGIVVIKAFVLSLGVLSLGSLFAKVAVWLFNTALIALKVIAYAAGLGIIGLIAAIGALVVSISLFVVLGGAILAVGSVVSELIGILLSLPTAYGPVKFFSGLFTEWFGIIKDIAWAMTNGEMKLAWEALKAAAKLGMEQLKAIWPPLWEAIKQGFDILWTYIIESMEAHFRLGLSKSMRVILDFFGKIADMWDEIPGPQPVVIALRAGIKEANKDLDAAEKQWGDVAAMRAKIATAELRQAFKGFNVEENDEIKKAREELDKVRKKIAEIRPQDKKKAEDEGLDLGSGMGAAINKGLNKELGKFDAVIRGSAEALGRIAKAKDILENPQERGRKGGRGGGIAGAGLAGARADIGPIGGDKVAMDNRDVLKEIRDILKGRKEVVLVPADIA